jgi:hypothetical protein
VVVLLASAATAAAAAAAAAPAAIVPAPTPPAAVVPATEAPAVIAPAAVVAPATPAAVAPVVIPTVFIPAARAAGSATIKPPPREAGKGTATWVAVTTGAADSATPGCDAKAVNCADVMLTVVPSVNAMTGTAA